MILQALYQLAQNEGLTQDPDYEWKPVAWLVRVGPDGEFLGFVGTHSAPAAPSPGRKAKVPKARPKSFAVPREPGRTSGDRAFFLVDKSEYAFGLEVAAGPGQVRGAGKLAARFALFRERIAACHAATRDEGVGAVLHLLERIHRGEVVVTLPPGGASNDLFAFIYDRDSDLLVSSRPAVRAYWQAQRSEDEKPGETKTLRCLVSGRLCQAVDKHPMVKNVPGGSTSGIALVSFNSSAFESYGWSGNSNAPVSREAAEACGTALNRLLHPAFPDPDPEHLGETLPRRNLRLSADTAVCYWTSHPQAEDLASFLGGLLDADPEKVAELYRSVWSGRSTEIRDPGAFFALTLSGEKGRAIVRDWFESSIQEVSSHLADHFEDLAIVRNTPAPQGRPHPPALPLPLLLRALAPRGDDKKIAPDWAAEVVHAALTGRPYPFNLLQRALERHRLEAGLRRNDSGQIDWPALERQDARAALIKAVLNRRLRFTTQPAHPKVTADMDPNNRTPGYLLGQLMAILERMQALALGSDINASVVDRFFGAASATPRAAFPRLLKGFRHHARKAKDDRRTVKQAISLEREADGLIVDLAEFPSFLPLEQQGLFVLGYHHRRHQLFRPADRAASDANTPSTETE